MGEIRQAIGVSGHLKAIITNVITGEVRVQEFDNKVTNAFLSRIAQWIIGINNTGQNPAFPPTKFQMGTGTGTVASTDTALFTPTAASFVNIGAVSWSGSAATITINYAPNVITGTFTEAGLLDVNSVLLTHLLLSPSVVIVANEAVSFVYTITLTAA